MKIISTNPADNYSLIGEVDASTKEEIQAKIQAAQEAKTMWKELGIDARIKLIEPIRDEFAKRTEEIAELISREMGKPIKESRSEVDRYTNGELAWFLDNAKTALADEQTLVDDEANHYIRYDPHGVVAAIAPWNFPFGMAIWGIFPNLIAGNTVVFKASEECPLVGKMIEEIINNHNLPEGVFAEIYGSGDAGKHLVEGNIDLIWFTGSTKTGKALYKTAADKFIKVVLEMGGSNPCIVFDDVDIVEIAPVIFGARFQNCGQVCSALKRLIIHESVVDDLVKELAKILEAKTLGNPLNASTDVSSLAAKRQQILAREQLDDALAMGAYVVAQKEIPKSLEGAYFPPTLVTNVNKDMRIWKEEVFGPILPIVTFTTEDEAIQLANDTPYGLGARVISSDKQRTARVASKIDAGSISINLENRFAPQDPFGGFKNSGMGRERGIHGLRELCQIKVIHDRQDSITA
jgi:acyl-CoA reductase-like NAD-dependent aldehyde dehydrogenase